MTSHRPEFVYGYHGCDESVAKRILEGDDPLSPSYNAYDWLGSGIYFWEDAPERAMQWAVEMKKPQSVIMPPRNGGRDSGRHAAKGP